jgi:hypothetical protein
MSRLLHAAYAQLVRTSSPRDTARTDRSGRFGCLQAKGQSPRHLRLHERTRSQGPFLRRRYPASSVIRPCPTPADIAIQDGVEAATLMPTGLPRFPHHLSGVPCPLPRRIGRVHVSITSPSVRPSPFCRRVGIRVSTFEACSGFTRVTAHRIAQPPKAAFVTRLRTGQLPNRSARQLPEQSTIPWMEPSSIGETRLRGALQKSRKTHHAGTLAIYGESAVFDPRTREGGAMGRALTAFHITALRESPGVNFCCPRGAVRVRGGRTHAPQQTTSRAADQVAYTVKRYMPSSGRSLPLMGMALWCARRERAPYDTVLS